MTTAERGDARRRWALAATASLVLHASLILWWSGVDLAPGGPAGGHAGGREGSAGFGPGSVIEVSIDVEAPVAAGTPVPAEEVAIQATPVAVQPTPQEAPPHPATLDSSLVTSANRGSGVGENSGAGTGTGEGSVGPGEGFGTGDGGVPGAVGARTGGGSGTTGGGTVPPRPIEITWPDTRKLSHCVGLRIDVRIRVDALGRVERVEPASTGLPEDCVRAALDTAKRIKFTPGTVDGKPATLWSLVTIDFEKGK